MPTANCKYGKSKALSRLECPPLTVNMGIVMLLVGLNVNTYVYVDLAFVDLAFFDFVSYHSCGINMYCIISVCS